MRERVREGAWSETVTEDRARRSSLACRPLVPERIRARRGEDVENAFRSWVVVDCRISTVTHAQAAVHMHRFPSAAYSSIIP